jgi:ubiquinone/menaquinone biosynthesis C-methylase UbiE
VSATWGTTHAQWAGCLYPRIFPFLKGRILEIALGCGRWTQFLREHCSSLIGVDLAAVCVNDRSKFKGDPRLHFEVGDGRTIPMVANASFFCVFHLIHLFTLKLTYSKVTHPNLHVF